MNHECSCLKLTGNIQDWITKAYHREWGEEVAADMIKELFDEAIDKLESWSS